jgi:hypothetical protein
MGLLQSFSVLYGRTVGFVSENALIATDLVDER